MTQPLWQLSDITHATLGHCAHSDHQPVTGISIDTRTLQPGDAFFAILGDTHDGHAFVAKAFEKGAACAVVNQSFVPDKTISSNVIKVKDTLKAMEALGVAARERAAAKIIAVTGSVGKTGTKEMLRLGLSNQGRTHASEKSYNNHWGVPLTLARMPQETAYGVFEIGMNHPGEITPLSKFVRPHVTIITTVEAVHLGFFSSVEDIAEAKAEIFAGLEPGGTAILNRDNSYFDLLKKRAESRGAKILSFGQSAEADSRLLDLTLHADHTEAKVSILGQPLTLMIGAAGAHLVMNALATLTAVQQVGGDIEQAASTLQDIKAQKGRGERHVFDVKSQKIALVDESYNANPASMRAALKAFSQLPRSEYPRRIAVLGDMLELGEHSERLHQELLEPIREAEIDLLFACGPHMASLYESLPAEKQGGYAENSAALSQDFLEAVKPGDALMIKGSLGSAMGPLVEAAKSYITSMK